MKSNLLIIGIFLFTQMAVIGASAEQETILERVTEIKDPELGELIRRALANSPGLEYDRAGKATLVRRVTESYLQITKLDEQIEETNRKIESSETSEADRVKLIKLRDELQTRLEKQLAELRETMNLVPQAKYKHSLDAFNTWLAFDVTGADSVCIFKYSKPFYEREPNSLDAAESPNTSKLLKIVTMTEAIEYLRGLVKSKIYFPIRIDIFRNSDGGEASEQLKKDIDWIVKSENLEWKEIEVFVDEQIRPKVGAMEVIIKQDGVFQPEGILLARGREDVIAWFKSQLDSKLTSPGGLPFRFYIQYNNESEDLAVKSAEAIKAMVDEMGLGPDLVRVVLLRDSFGRRQLLEDFNSWLLLDAIGDAVYVLKVQKPFNWYDPADPVRIMSHRETISYIRDLVQVEDRLPIRLTIFRNAEGEGPSMGLFNRVVRLVKDMNIEGRAWVCLDGAVRPSGRKDEYTLKRGKWYHGIGEDISEQPLDSELPNFISNLTSARSLPYELNIEFDHESKDLAKDIVEIMEKAAKELALEQCVKVEAEAVKNVNNWLALDVLQDDIICLYDYSKPYRAPLNQRTECRLVSVASADQTLNFVKDFVGDKGNLPLWLDIYRSEGGSDTAEELYRQIVQVFRDAGLNSDTQVYLDREAHYDNLRIEMFKIRKRYVSGSSEPMEIDSNIYLNDLNRPGCLPYKLHIEFDRRSKDLAVKVGKDVSEAAKAAGIEKLVEIKLAESKP
jgi:hypothetical protein